MDHRDEKPLDEPPGDADDAEHLEAAEDEQSELSQRQYALGTVFYVITVAGMYFAVERYSGGRFALFTVIVLAVLAPLLYIFGWLARALFEAGPLGTLVWIAGVAALVALGLLAIFGA